MQTIPQVINHIGISGGKDSTALLLWAVYESGYDHSTIRASFADTGNESPLTYTHVAMLSERVFPIHTIKPERDFYELARWKKRFPSARARFCTQLLKMQPAKDYIDGLIAEGYEVLMHSGVRANESHDRSKLPEREPACNSYFGCPEYRPLLKWTIEDVWAIHDRYGIPHNPLYAMGCKRVGCLPCIMSRKSEIANIALRFPDRIELIASEETTVTGTVPYRGFFTRDKIPERYRSKQIIAKGRKVVPGDNGGLFDVDAEEVRHESGAMNVATIDDVVRWSLDDGALQNGSFDYDDDETTRTCDMRYGACE